MKRPKIKKIVSKKIKSGKRMVKRSKKSIGNKDYAEMLIHNEEKTMDSETLIKEAPVSYTHLTLPTILLV